ncbi:DUF6153 family protein [Streptomyces sp. NPDC091377]|uniref:DUF6153 family protein n=1 Tax=Streptomyces sp. NPDC091377 TaxID=3365995 RepID=UPI0038148885
MTSSRRHGSSHKQYPGRVSCLRVHSRGTQEARGPLIHAYDDAVTRHGQLTRPHSTVRSRGLLVCALLLGLLGMHGLGSVPDTAADTTGHDRVAAATHADVMASMPGGCDHGEGGCTGHVDHADPTCASASVAGTPAVVPVLVPDVVTCAEPSGTRTSPAGSGPDGGRAPPQSPNSSSCGSRAARTPPHACADEAACLGMPFTDPSRSEQIRIQEPQP